LNVLIILEIFYYTQNKNISNSFLLEKQVLYLTYNYKNYTRVLTKITPDGSVTYRLIDSDGYPILGNADIWIP